MPFCYRAGSLHCEEADLAEVALRHGTPCYVYSSRAIAGRYRAYDEAFAGAAHTVCYAVKANSNLSVLRLLAAEGAGFDIVSGGELFRVLQAGGDPRKTVFSGVGKTADEIVYALDQNIHSFNCESRDELALLDSIARSKGMKARVAVRVNPDVDASTHPYISTGLREHKFGIDISEIESVYAWAASCQGLSLEGVSCHIGSQLLDTAPVMEAVDRMLALVDRLRAAGIPIRYLDLGGGLGIRYRPADEAPSISSTMQSLRAKAQGRDLHLMVEPGRSIVGEAGVLLTRILLCKKTTRKEFIVVDAAMNDLIRPALYQSHHEILPVREPSPESARSLADIVGPVCETGDFLARNREMPAVEAGDLLAIAAAGAYGFVLSSNYNARPRAAEVMVHGSESRIARRRETWDDLVRGE